MPVPKLIVTPEDVRHLRRVAHLTLEQMSRKLGVSLITYWRWEKGNHIPSRLAMLRLVEMENRLLKQGQKIEMTIADEDRLEQLAAQAKG